MNPQESSFIDGAEAPFWNLSSSEVIEKLQTSPVGLSEAEAKHRLETWGPNLLKPGKRSDTLYILISQFKSPITLILLFAAGLSFFLRDSTDAIIILFIVMVSSFLGFWQERGATNAVEKLLAIVKTKVSVIREGSRKEIPVEEVVPGDVVELSAGAAISGDCVLIDSKNLFVNEASLTGETYPVEKTTGALPIETAMNRRLNSLFMGTHVVSGTARALVVKTGERTEFGKISQRLKLRPAETDFERGIRRFGFFLMEITLIFVIAIFAANVFLAKPVMDAFLFSLALAVGLTPQRLPAIISVNLSHGANRMAQKKVIVKRLSSIENFGSMDILCSDKTGTLTEGLVRLHSFQDISGNENENIIRYAFINAHFETGFINPLDEAIRSYRRVDVSEYQKLDELPYDFIRKRLSVLVSTNGKRLLATKGALANVLQVCSSAESSDGNIVKLEDVREQIQEKFETFSNQGFRTLGVAYRSIDSESTIQKEHESSMVFSGFLVFHDPPKPGVAETVGHLNSLGVTLKVITGDNQLIASHVSAQVGLKDAKILSGTDLRRMSDEALIRCVGDTDVFAEVEPNQKERIILALKKSGHVVGYMGDGINDATALHAADISISVADAVDVAKNAADIVLLEKDLDVLIHGVQEGRRTFMNSLKYVFMATSANFGNMFSMAGASLFFPFLPLLPKQILLMNLMTDFPEMTIATDNVSPETVQKPRRWNIRFIRNFMITFGLLSSVFDYLTFGVLILFLHASTEQFRSAWFIAFSIPRSLAAG